MAGVSRACGTARRLVIGATALACAASGLLLAGPATVIADDCTGWDITGGTWEATQGASTLSFDFRQTATSLTGTATLPQAEADAAGYSGNTGPLTGTLTGTAFAVAVTWPPKIADGYVARGEYDATLSVGNGVGTLVGKAHDLSLGPSAPTVDWTANGPAACTSSVATLAAPSPSVDAERALRNALGPSVGSLPASANESDAVHVGDDLAAVLTMALPSWVPTQQVVDSVSAVGYLAAARDAGDHPLYPSIADPGMLRVLLQMLTNAVAATDTAVADSWVTATQRLLRLLVNQDIAAGKAPA